MSAYAKIAAIDAKIAKLNEDRAALVLVAENEVNTEAVKKGDTVTANYGRGESATVITGKVIAVKAEPGKAKLVKLEIGSDFDTQVVVVFAAAITAVTPLVEDAGQDSAAE